MSNGFPVISNSTATATTSSGSVACGAMCLRAELGFPANGRKSTVAGNGCMDSGPMRSKNCVCCRFLLIRLEAGPSSPAPVDNYLWTPGCWNWQGSGYAWQAGFWYEGPTQLGLDPQSLQLHPSGLYFRQWVLGLSRCKTEAGCMPPCIGEVDMPATEAATTIAR